MWTRPKGEWLLSRRHRADCARRGAARPCRPIYQRERYGRGSRRRSLHRFVGTLASGWSCERERIRYDSTPCPTPPAYAATTSRHDATRRLTLLGRFPIPGVFESAGSVFDSLPDSSALSLLCLVFAIANGQFFRTSGSSPGTWLIAYSGCLLVASLSGVWPGGSITLLTDRWSKSLLVFFHL